ncbi:hypothetical protein K457DRAFT_684474 [Linnemannia elongata AG-77]|uniref:Uncharacterized protein n=1 Tax=Linnemannia elongata AG-77 TaxID=1314771 RepID=A0A197JQJ4_9FUNG|nr:hypothetical protein K457DRAFT_684474 [Linnemannia elongata AG-77]
MAPKSRENVTSDIESSDDEGIKSLDYKPPRDFSLHTAKKHTHSVFDVDEASKHELWLIRVPEGVSNEDLETMSITLPPSTKPTTSKETTTLGSLKKKEISAYSSATTTIKYHLQTVSPESGIAGEMLSLQPLIPAANKGGRLLQAPNGVHQHLALVASTSIPSGQTLGEEILSRPIPKREQPEGLKQRFQFAGTDSPVPGAKLSGSGKKFAAEWLKTLEKREREAEEEAEKKRQKELEAAMEDEESQPSPAKKRKGEDMEVDGTEEKKIKKEKKEKKEKKDKKEKKEKKNKD